MEMPGLKFGLSRSSGSKVIQILFKF